MIELRSLNARGSGDEGDTTLERPILAQSKIQAKLPGSCQMAEEEISDFAAKLLDALTDMAARSKRGQADVTAALRGAAIEAEPRQVRAALRLLHAQGCVDKFVPLSDGGLLLSVTRRSTRQFGEASQWLPLDEPQP